VIVVTGGAGFIGSNLVRALNERGRRDLLVVDDLRDGHKLLHLTDCEFHDLIDKDDFLRDLDDRRSFPERIDAILHQGACADTTEWDGRLMIESNYVYSKALLRYCTDNRVPLIYASSAAVYGGGKIFREDPQHESPLNLYGFSKLLFDRYVRKQLGPARTQLVGLRYFNVYGPGEDQKGDMASVAYKLHMQLLHEDRVQLFEGSDAYANGEQRRDFVWAGDIASVNLWLLDHPEVSGIYNVGTGRSQTFNEVAQAVLKHHGRGEIEYIPFPEHLRGRYQSFTEADISRLRRAGYDEPFLSVQEGIPRYLASLEARATPPGN
jgi:ADP-L-glycero-D-manno-heptose 6-epimerase